MRLAFAIVLLAFAAAAQTVDSNSITVLVNRNVSIPAEQVEFDLTVTAPADMDLSAVISALANAGVPPVTLTGLGSRFGGLTVIPVYPPNLTPAPASSSLTWQFSYKAPYSRLKENLTALAKSTKSFLTPPGMMQLSYAIGASSASDASVADAQGKLLPLLIDDARKQAARIADAAGLNAGPILAVSDSGYPTAAYAALVLGSSATPTLSVSRSIAVKFAATRY